MKVTRLIALLLIGCGTLAPPPRLASPPIRPVPATVRIDDVLLDRALHAIAMQFEDRSWLGDLQVHRQLAPSEELAWIDKALNWGEHPFSASHNDPDLAAEIGNGLAAVYPKDPCISAIAVDVTKAISPPELVDVFVKCFPNLARAHQLAGEKCRQMPEVPAERELQIVACAKSFARCIEIDAHSPRCATALGELQYEWTAPYCTTASLWPKLRVELQTENGAFALGIADFEYGVQAKTYTSLVLSVRGRRHVQAWFDTVKSTKKLVKAQVTTRVGSFTADVWRETFTIELLSPTPADVCDQLVQRKISDFP